MTKVEALKELYKAMGGAEDTEDKQTVAEMLNMISDIGEGEHSDDIAEAIKNIADVAGSITPTPAIFEVNINATKITDTTLGITSDKTFSETMQALNNGDNVVATLTIIVDDAVQVCENVCCGIAHSSTSPYNAFIYITVEAEEDRTGPITVHWLSNSDTATIVSFSSSYLAIGR